MKSIKKLKSTGKAVAGSALLVGATLTGAAGLAAAQDSGSSMDLGDYPSPFVDSEGNVDSTIVVGEQARTADVVGAINVAGSLGNAAFTEETVQVSTSGAGGTWSASNGVTLDTTNDNLYYGDDISAVRDTLTQNDLGILEETTFTNDDNDETDITNYLNVGDKAVTFGNGPDGIDDDEDPVLHVPLDSESEVGPGSSSHLFNLQANFGESINFTAEEVRGEDIELFGTSYTVSEDNGDESDELILYGASESVTVASGEETTVTVDEEEQTMGVTAVTDSDTAAITVNGELEEYDEDESFTVNGQEVRVDNIIQTSQDQSEGTVVFSIGSQELVLQNEEPIQDSDGDDIEGSYVEFDGGNTDNIYSGISSIDLYVGAEDDEEDYVEAGETFTHSALPGVEFQFGGLNPNAAESEDATEVTVQTNGDTDAEVSFTAEEGDSVTQSFFHEDDDSGDSDLDDDMLQDSDGDDIVVQEGATLQEDDYFTSDAGDFSHMWEVTSIDRDDTGSNIESTSEATIELSDAVSGNSVEVDIDAVDGEDGSTGTDDDYYAGEEIIDGQSYKFVLEGSDDSGPGDGTLVDNDEPDFQVVWGDSSALGSTGTEDIDDASVLDTGATGSGALSLFTAVDTANNGALAFATQLGEDGASQSAEVARLTGVTSEQSITMELPSTQSTDAQTLAFTVDPDDGTSSEGEVTYSVNGGSETVLTDADGDGDLGVTVGTVEYNIDYNAVNLNSGSNPEFQIDSVAVDTNQGSSGPDGIEHPAAVFMQPENEDDNENAFVLTPEGQDSDNGYQFDAVPAYTGGTINTEALEGSDEDVEAGYNEYGTYVEADTEDEGSVSLMMPAGQSTAGAAFTGSDGSISAAAGGSGSATTQTPTGWPDAAALDSEVTGSDRNQNLVLVGGPAVNTLTEELASQNMTWTADQYSEDQWVLDLTEGFDGEGGSHALVVAGYAAQDTVAASNYISNYADNAEELAGQSTLQMTTSASQ